MGNENVGAGRVAGEVRRKRYDVVEKTKWAFISGEVI